MKTKKPKQKKAPKRKKMNLGKIVKISPKELNSIEVYDVYACSCCTTPTITSGTLYC